MDISEGSAKAIRRPAVMFVVLLGAVSLFADITYEGARSRPAGQLLESAGGAYLGQDWTREPVSIVLERILEIALAADSEKQDGTKIGYAIPVQRHGDSIKIPDSGGIPDFKREFIQDRSGAAAVPALKGTHIAGSAASPALALKGYEDLHAPAAICLFACQADLHGQGPKPLRL